MIILTATTAVVVHPWPSSNRRGHPRPMPSPTFPLRARAAAHRHEQ
jgi:hypothetical protein